MKKIILPMLLLIITLISMKLAAQEVVQVTDNDYPDWNPQISGSHLAWAGSIFGDQVSQIFYYGLNEQSAPVALTDDDLAKQGLDISGDKLVWAGGSNPDDPNTLEIYYYDLSVQGPAVQLTDNGIFDAAPQISGNNVVWFGRHSNLSNAYNRIYYMGISITTIRSREIQHCYMM